MLPKAQNPGKPRDRLPAGSPIAEMVAQEQKTNSPNFSIITEELVPVNCAPVRELGRTLISLGSYDVGAPILAG